MRWLHEEASDTTAACMIGGAALLILISNSIAIMIMNHCGVTPSHLPAADGTNPLTTWYFPFLLMEYALMEEIIFRLPLAILITSESVGTKGIMLLAGILSFMFGVAHGGLSHLPIQGISGFVFCLVFLKCGGLQKQFAKATAASAMTHFLFNLTVTIILIGSGATRF